MSARSEEIVEALCNWGRSRTVFATFTLKHDRDQSFELLLKLITAAYGVMWSGRAGTDLARFLGGPLEPPRAAKKRKPLKLAELVPPPTAALAEEAGWKWAKPHSVRAHDLTWSNEHGFHPHLHCLLFLHKPASDPDLLPIFTERWRECARIMLGAFHELAGRVARFVEWQETGTLTQESRDKATRNGWHKHEDRWRPKAPSKLRREWAKLPELEAREAYAAWIETHAAKLRSRCEKTFGLQMFPRARSLAESTLELVHKLQHFTWERLAPSDDRGVRLETVRRPDDDLGRAKPGADRDRKIARYLAKLGLELANMGTKKGKVGEDGIEHFGQWQVANIAADPQHPLHAPARGAWAELYRAKKGTQALTWSKGSREALCIAVRRDEEIEQETPAPTEMTRLIGQIDGAVWDSMCREQRHVLIARIHQAYQHGFLTQLSCVKVDGLEHATMLRAVPAEPLERSRHYWEWWQVERERQARGKAPHELGKYRIEQPDAEQRAAALQHLIDSGPVGSPGPLRDFERVTRGRARVPREAWTRMSPEEREEAVHQARESLEQMHLLIGGTRPRRSASVDPGGASATVPESSTEVERLMLLCDCEICRTYARKHYAVSLAWLVDEHQAAEKRNAARLSPRGVAEVPSLQERKPAPPVLPGFAGLVKPGSR